jgi:hypothetical protein
MMMHLLENLLPSILCISRDALGGVIESGTTLLVPFTVGSILTMDTCSDLAFVGNLSLRVSGFRKRMSLSATATLEPHTEAIGKTQGAHLDEVIPPVLSLNTSQLGVGKSTTPIDTFPASATTLSTVTHSSASQQSPSMVNFTMDPLPYTPPSLFLEDGGPHSHNRRWVFVS